MPSRIKIKHVHVCTKTCTASAGYSSSTHPNSAAGRDLSAMAPVQPTQGTIDGHHSIKRDKLLNYMQLTGVSCHQHTSHTTPHSHHPPRAPPHMCCCCSCCATARRPVARPANKALPAPYKNSITRHGGAKQQPAEPPQHGHARWAPGNSSGHHRSGFGANLPLVPTYWRWPTCTTDPSAAATTR